LPLAIVDLAKEASELVFARRLELDQTVDGYVELVEILEELGRVDT
jgi:hypothetical protein